MKDMDGKPIEVGDIVRIHIWGSDKEYHPVCKIVSVHRNILMQKVVELQGVTSGCIRSFMHRPSVDIAKVEIEDLI